MGILDVLVGTVSNVVNTFGVDVDWMPKDEAIYDPDTGQKVVTPRVYTVKAVWVDYEQQEIDGDTIQATDRGLILAAGDLTREPAPDDEIAYKGKTYRIVHSKPTQATEEVAMYELQLRR